MKTAWIITRDTHLPLDRRRCFGPNYYWVVPAERGWQPVYFYAREDTARTTCNNHQRQWPMEEIEIVEVAIEVSPVVRTSCDKCGTEKVEVA